jgi:DinB superfamily
MLRRHFRQDWIERTEVRIPVNGTAIIDGQSAYTTCMATASQDALTGWSRRLIAELDASDRRAEQLAKTLTLEQLNWRPRPDAWSIGQCLQHLSITNEVYLSAIAASLEGERRSQVEEIVPGWFGRWFIRSFVEPSAKTRRVRAPKKIDPGQQVESTVLETFLRSNNTARDLIRRASSYDVNRIRFGNPFVPMIRFTAGTGFEIVSKHQNRHLLQAEGVRGAADFPAQAR